MHVWQVLFCSLTRLWKLFPGLLFPLHFSSARLRIVSQHVYAVFVTLAFRAFPFLGRRERELYFALHAVPKARTVPYSTFRGERSYLTPWARYLCAFTQAAESGGKSTATSFARSPQAPWLPQACPSSQSSQASQGSPEPPKASKAPKAPSVLLL